MHVPADFPVQPTTTPSAPGHATCGTCGLTWDDNISTAYTPTPGGRCPFEAFHDDEEIPLLTKAMLSGDPGTVLVCGNCGDTWSATPGDYFWLDDDEPFECSGCGLPALYEARKVLTYHPV